MVMRKKGHSVIFNVLVQPKASEDRIVGFHGDDLKVKVTAPPTGGKANQRLIEILAERLNVTKSEVEIIRGHTSRKKAVRIGNVSLNHVKNRLA
jgi:uncharacterized protein (TIGR00251 family)